MEFVYGQLDDDKIGRLLCPSASQCSFVEGPANIQNIFSINWTNTIHHLWESF